MTQKDTSAVGGQTPGNALADGLGAGRRTPTTHNSDSAPKPRAGLGRGPRNLARMSVEAENFEHRVVTDAEAARWRNDYDEHIHALLDTREELMEVLERIANEGPLAEDGFNPVRIARAALGETKRTCFSVCGGDAGYSVPHRPDCPGEETG